MARKTKAFPRKRNPDPFFKIIMKSTFKFKVLLYLCITLNNKPMTTAQPHPQTGLALTHRLIIGAAAGLLVASYFLLMLNPNHPDWGRFWMIQPLLVLPFAGTMAGLCNYIIMRYRTLIGVNRYIALFGSIMVSIVGLWMGIVLGFHGTMWN